MDWIDGGYVAILVALALSIWVLAAARNAGRADDQAENSEQQEAWEWPYGWDES